ncbi:MAG: hypothetical protein IJI71_15550 [Clostridia bacterium]|nr:hypothetical protein [Clostridia bacterium]
MARSNSKRQPSVLNWMGTLILYAIPGVNLIFLILSAIFAKSTSKRSFAIAGILLIIISALLTFLAFMIFPDFFTRLAEYMRQPMRTASPAGVLPPA